MQYAKPFLIPDENMGNTYNGNFGHNFKKNAKIFFCLAFDTHIEYNKSAI